MDRFTSMSMFVRVVERGSLAAAAEGSGMTATMAGNHVRALERRLGARLLNRTTRRQSLTEIGRSYYEQCLAILSQIEAAETDAREMRAQPRGQLRVSAPVAYGTRKLVPALADFLERQPQVRIDLALNDRIVDITEEGYDAAIRIGPLPDSSLVARPLRPSPRLPCASPAYLARHGVPRTPRELEAHNCLPYAFASGTEREWSFPRPQGGIEKVKIRGRLDINGGFALREAALAGIGIILQPEMMLHEDIASGRLVRLLPDYPMPNFPVHLVYLPDRRMTPKLSSFVEFMRKSPRTLHSGCLNVAGRLRSHWKCPVQAKP